MDFARLVFDGSGADLFRHGAELRPGDTLVGQVGEALGDDRYRLIVGGKSYVAASSRPLGEKAVLRLRVQKVSPRIVLSLESPGAESPPESIRAATASESLRSALRSSLPADSAELTERFVRTVDDRFSVNARTVFVARQFLSNGIAPPPELVEEIAREVFADRPPAPLPEGSPGGAVKLTDLVRLALESPRQFEAAARAALEATLARVLGASDELGAIDRTLAELEGLLETESSLEGRDRLARLLRDAFGLLDRTTGSTGAMLEELDSLLKNADSARLRELFTTLEPDLLKQLVERLDAVRSPADRSSVEALLRELIDLLRRGPVPHSRALLARLESALDGDLSRAREILVQIRSEQARLLADDPLKAAGLARERDAMELARRTIATLRRAPTPAATELLASAESALATKSYGELWKSLEAIEADYFQRLRSARAIRSALQSLSSEGSASRDLLNGLGRFSDPSFFYTEVVAPFGRELAAVRLKVAFRGGDRRKDVKKVRRIVIDVTLSRLQRVVGEIVIEESDLGLTFHLQNGRARELFERYRGEIERALRELGFEPRVAVRARAPEIRHPLLEDSPAHVAEGSEIDVIV